MKEFRIEHASRRVFIKYSGRVGDEELQEGIAEYGPLDAGYTLYVDLADVSEFDVTTKGIQKAAARAAPANRKRCAIVAPTDVAFGLARMFQVYSGNPYVEVFRSAAEAHSWLDGR